MNRRFIWLAVAIVVGLVLYVAISETTARRNAVRVRNAEQPDLQRRP